MTIASTEISLSRRGFLAGATAFAGAALLSGCDTVGPAPRYAEPLPPEAGVWEPELMYAAMEDNGFQLPAIPFEKIDPRYYRQVVSNPTGEAPGTVVVDTTNHFLYVVRPGGRAIRYGVGLGREGFAWSGRAIVQWKQKWPRWKVPPEMVARDPKLGKYSIENGGMEPGLKNPLGARALYLFQDGEDTQYRFHGSPEWASIGKNMSSGCVRLINQDVIDLYDRVPQHAPVLVTGEGEA